MEETTRRALVRKLAALAAAGYVAPKVTRIDAARAHHNSGPPTSPFGGGSGPSGRRRRRRKRRD